MKVDGIEVSVESSAAKANAELDKLIAKLSSVSAAIVATKSTSGNFSSMANGIQKLGNAMQSISGVGLPAFNRLAKGIDRLGTVDTASIQRSASAITLIGKSFNNLGPVSSSAVQFGELAKNLSKFGYKSTTSAVDNIPKLATAMSQLMTTLSKAPAVSQNLIQMTNALANLASHGKAAGTASKSLSSGLNMFSSSAVKARKSSTSIAAAFGKFYATYWLLIRAATKFKDAIDISSNLTEVQNVVDTTFGKYAALVEKMSESSIQNFGMSELSVKQISSRFQAMGTAMGFAQGKMANMSIELTKLAADMASFYNVEQTDVAEDLESIFTGQTRPLRTYGLDLTEATLKEWAMKQGMDADIESMGIMEKAMLRYRYVINGTSAAQGDFARTADTWANQTRILKQSFEQLASIIGGTLINTFKPFVVALNVVLQKVIVFAEKVSEALGAIFGWKYESNTAGIVTDFDDLEDSAGGTSDNLADAAKNAKKLRNTIFGYDELNARADNDSSSSGSGSAGTIGAGSSGGLVETDSILKKYWGEIKNLFELGETIGKSLTDAMSGINWEGIYKGAKDFGKGLADFLNGLISPELFGATGRTIAGALNAAIYAALSFGETFEWDEFGLSIATGINEFFATFDFKSFANTIDTWVQGVRDTIKEAIGNLDWGTIWDGVKDFLSEIDVETISILVSAFAIKTTGTALKSLLMGSLAAGLGGVSAGAGITLFVAMAAVVTWSFVDDVGKRLDNIRKYGWTEASKMGADKESNPYRNGSAAVQEDGSGSWDKVIDDRIKKQEEYNDKTESQWSENKAKFDAWVDGMSIKWGEFKLKLSEKWDGVQKWFDDNVSPWFTSEKWTELYGNIKTSLETKWGEAVTWWEGTGVYKWWTEDVAPWFTEKGGLNCMTISKKSLAKKWGEVVTWWRSTGAYKWYEDNVKPLFEEKKWSFAGIKDGLTNIFNAAIESVKGLWNKFATWLNEKLTFNLDTSTLIGKGISNLLGTSTIKLANIPMLADGGIVNAGQLFIANERAPEVIANLGGGQTGVLPVDSLEQSIENGVASGMAQVAMSMMSGNQNGQVGEIHIHHHVGMSETVEIYKIMKEAGRVGLIPQMT